MMLNGRNVKVTRFNNRTLALSFADRCEKFGVMLGDDGTFWVATYADCQRLEAAGYEWAR